MTLKIFRCTFVHIYSKSDDNYQAYKIDNVKKVLENHKQNEQNDNVIESKASER